MDSLENAISTKELKEKLEQLERYMSLDKVEYLIGKERSVYEIGKRMAKILNDTCIVPEGFINAGIQALCDLTRGIDGQTGERIDGGSLEGYSMALVGLWSREIPNIATAVCPLDFAENVKEAYEKAAGRR